MSGHHATDWREAVRFGVHKHLVAIGDPQASDKGRRGQECIRTEIDVGCYCGNAFNKYIAESIPDGRPIGPSHVMKIPSISPPM